jgi:hypothetical protein
MPTYLGQSSGDAVRFPVVRGQTVARDLHAAFARERIEEVLRAVAEDAFSPGLAETPPWHDESAFTHDLLAAIHEIADTADRLLAERLTNLLEAAPPDLAGRLGAAPRFSDPS